MRVLSFAQSNVDVIGPERREWIIMWVVIRYRMNDNFKCDVTSSFISCVTRVFFFPPEKEESPVSSVRNLIIKLEFIENNFVPIYEEYIYEILFII